ncbi:MAG: hypothetical protein ACI898_001268 [Flavobacteriales bacterium]|jgi:hypothetical protein
MRTFNWKERRIVATSYSELLLDIEDQIDGNKGVVLEVMGNSGIQSLFSKLKTERRDAVTVLEKSFLARIIRFSVGAPVVLVQKKNLLSDVFNLARENGKSICLLTTNIHSELHSEQRPSSAELGRIKNLFTDSKTKEQLIQFIMSQGIDLVVTDIHIDLAEELRQVCAGNYQKKFLWVQMVNQKENFHLKKTSHTSKTINWLKKSGEVIICAYKVLRYRPFFSQENR